MRNQTFIVFAMLLLSTLSPLGLETTDSIETVTTSSTTARAPSTDVNITGLEWIGPSYYCNPCVTDVLAPGFQQVRVTLENEGLLYGSGALSFRLDAADGLGMQPMSSQSI